MAGGYQKLTGSAKILVSLWSPPDQNSETAPGFEAIIWVNIALKNLYMFSIHQIVSELSRPESTCFFCYFSEYLRKSFTLQKKSVPMAFLLLTLQKAGCLIKVRHGAWSDLYSRFKIEHCHQISSLYLY